MKITKTIPLQVCVVFGVFFSACSQITMSSSKFQNSKTPYEQSNQYNAAGDSVSTIGGYASDDSWSDTFNEISKDNPAKDTKERLKGTMKPYKQNGKWYHPQQVNLHDSFDGIASWYGPKFHAKKTASGEKYDMNKHTAAHKTMPMGTMVRVHNVENGKQTTVRINDRGPFVEGRIIDVSKAAAQDLDMMKKGTAKVRLEVVGFQGVVNVDSQEVLNADEMLREEFEVGETPRSITGGKFAIQIGAFKRVEGAQETKEKNNIYMPYVVNIIKGVDSNNEEIYRVMLEGFQSEEEARDFMKTHSKDFEDKFLVRE